jgi:outer membrane protein assembly factor BamB
MHYAIFLLTASLTAPPDAWPAFLGQGASKIDPATIPLTWSPTENIAWQAKLPGKGQSSPVIWGDRVFVTAIEGTMKEKCHLVALSLEDGRELWRQTLDSPQTVRSTYTQSRAAPTPVVDADHVYAFFETGVVVATDHSGKPLWQRALTEDYGPFESTIGLASSPILVNDLLAILIDHEGPSYLLGLDVKTGATRWKTERTSRTSYSSPALVPIAGTQQIVCSSSGSIDGYDPKSGEMLWTFEENVGGNRTGAPLAIRDGMFAIGASPGMHNEREEQARKTNFLMRVELVDGKFVPKVLWRTEEAMPSYNSPMVYGDFAYWVNRAGVVFCFDAATGKSVYSQRSGGTCWATPVGIGDRVYLFGKDGMTTVLAVGPEYKVLAENMLWDPEKAGRDSMQRNRSSGGHQGHEATPGEKGESSTGDKPKAEASAVDRPKDVPTTERKSSADDKPSRAAEPEAAPDSPPAGRRGRPSGAGTGTGRPPMTEKEMEENRARNVNRFADPVQYGVAIVNGSLVIRTGEVVYCIRSGASTTVAK